MIREATREDVPRLVALGVMFMRESSYSVHFGTNLAAMRGLAQMLIDAPNGMVLVNEQDGQVTGMIGVIATQHPYSGDPVMSELFWYVLPKARGGGVKLLLAAQEWARANGIAKSIVVAPEGHDAVEGIYERLGYQPLERQFIKDL